VNIPIPVPIDYKKILISKRDKNIIKQSNHKLKFLSDIFFVQYGLKCRSEPFQLKIVIDKRKIYIAKMGTLYLK